MSSSITSDKCNTQLDVHANLCVQSSRSTSSGVTVMDATHECMASRLWATRWWETRGLAWLMPRPSGTYRFWLPQWLRRCRSHQGSGQPCWNTRGEFGTGKCALCISGAVESLLKDHPEERPPWRVTTLKRDHPGGWPPWRETTLVGDHPDKRPPWGETPLSRNHPKERPHWRETTLMWDHPDARPPWCETLMRDHPDERYPDESPP